MPITWSAEMDRKLLLAILKVHDIPIDKNKVAEELSTEDQPCTSMAVQKRLQAIRTMIKNGTEPEDTPKAKATPRKRGAAASNDESPSKKTKTTKSKGGKAKNGSASEGEGEGADEDVVKEEGVDEDELPF